MKPKITTEELILAKTDDEALLNVLSKLELYIHKIVDIMYIRYGASSDASLSREDLYSFCQANIVVGIKRYYHPEKYEKKKDTHGRYNDGFYYIANITEKWIRHYQKYHARLKRIPHGAFISLDAPIVPDEESMIGDLVGDVRVQSSMPFNGLFIDQILEFYKNKKHGYGVNVKNLVVDILNGIISYEVLADKHHTTVSAIKTIIINEIKNK